MMCLYMEQSDALDVLRTFRDSLYGRFERRAEAFFELTDAILTAGVAPSPVHLRSPVRLSGVYINTVTMTPCGGYP